MGKNTGKMIDMRVGQYHENRAILFPAAFPDNERQLFCLLRKTAWIDQEDDIRRCDQVRIGGDGIDLSYERVNPCPVRSRDRMPGKGG